MPRRFTIGRDRASDIAIADDSVSRLHAEIWLEDDGTLMLADHGSSNGTELIRAGEASTLSKATVAPGDHVRFGAVTLAVKDLIDAIELKHPGALTRSPHAEIPPQKPAPPSPPPLPRQPVAPPPLPPAANVAPPPLPPAPPAIPPPDHQQAPLPVAPPLPDGLSPPGPTRK
jgi:hypothetical protein